MSAKKSFLILSSIFLISSICGTAMVVTQAEIEEAIKDRACYVYCKIFVLKDIVYEMHRDLSERGEVK